MGVLYLMSSFAKYNKYLGDPDNNKHIGVELAVNVVVGSMRGINEGRGMPLSLFRGFLRG